MLQVYGFRRGRRRSHGKSFYKQFKLASALGRIVRVIEAYRLTCLALIPCTLLIIVALRLSCTRTQIVVGALTGPWLQATQFYSLHALRRYLATLPARPLTSAEHWASFSRGTLDWSGNSVLNPARRRHEKSTASPSFLVPYLVGSGANNLLMQLQTAAILANVTGRTLCLPPLRQHYRDVERAGGQAAVMLGDLVDLDKLSEFVALLSIEDCARACDKTIHLVWNFGFPDKAPPTAATLTSSLEVLGFRAPTYFRPACSRFDADCREEEEKGSTPRGGPLGRQATHWVASADRARVAPLTEPSSPSAANGALADTSHPPSLPIVDISFASPTVGAGPAPNIQTPSSVPVTSFPGWQLWSSPEDILSHTSRCAESACVLAHAPWGSREGQSRPFSCWLLAYAEVTPFFIPSAHVGRVSSAFVRVAFSDDACHHAQVCATSSSAATPDLVSEVDPGGTPAKAGTSTTKERSGDLQPWSQGAYGRLRGTACGSLFGSSHALAEDGTSKYCPGHRLASLPSQRSPDPPQFSETSPPEMPRSVTAPDFPAPRTSPLPFSSSGTHVPPERVPAATHPPGAPHSSSQRFYGAAAHSDPTSAPFLAVHLRQEELKCRSRRTPMVGLRRTMGTTLGGQWGAPAQDGKCKSYPPALGTVAEHAGQAHAHMQGTKKLHEQSSPRRTAARNLPMASTSMPATRTRSRPPGSGQLPGGDQGGGELGAARAGGGKDDGSEGGKDGGVRGRKDARSRSPWPPFCFAATLPPPFSPSRHVVPLHQWRRFVSLGDVVRVIKSFQQAAGLTRVYLATDIRDPWLLGRVKSALGALTAGDLLAHMTAAAQSHQANPSGVGIHDAIVVPSQPRGSHPPGAPTSQFPPMAPLGNQALYSGGILAGDDEASGVGMPAASSPALLSAIEQEVCARATWFLGTSVSSWTEMVIARRVTCFHNRNNSYVDELACQASAHGCI